MGGKSPPEPLGSNGSFICRSSLAAFVMGWVPYVASCPMWEPLCFLPCQVHCSIADGRASRESARAKCVLCLYLLGDNFGNMFEHPTAGELIPTQKHLILLSDHLALMCVTWRWEIHFDHSILVQQTEHGFQEVLVSRSILLRVELYTQERKKLRILGGDILMKGGLRRRQKIKKNDLYSVIHKYL